MKLKRIAIPTRNARRLTATEPLTIVCLDAQPFAQIATQGVDANGQPFRRYVKEVIRTGWYVKESDDLEFEATPAMLSNWVAEFGRMKENGVKVTVPETHRGDGIPRLNRGFVDDLFVADNPDGSQSLFMSCTLVGADSIKLASVADVSLYSPATFTDGKGNTYQRPIRHVALVTDPVVPGLGAFIPIAASLARSQNMDLLELIKKIGQALGITEDITDQNAATLVVPAVNALIDKVKGGAADTPPAGGDTPPAPAMSTPDAGAAPAATPAVPAVAAAAAPQIKRITTEYAASLAASPMVVKSIADSRRLQIDNLLEKGKVNAAVHKRLIDRWVGTENKAVALSLASGSDGKDFDEMIADFMQNTSTTSPRPNGNGSMHRIELSDDRKGGGRRTLSGDAEQRAKAAAARA